MLQGRVSHVLKLKVEEFKDHLKQAAVETRFRPMDFAPHEEPPKVLGWVDITVSTPVFSVTRRRIYEHPQYKPSRIDIYDDIDQLWEVHRIDVIVEDKNGDVLSEEDILNILPVLCPACDEIDYSDLDLDEVENVDGPETLEEPDPEGAYETFVLEVDDARNLEFDGFLVVGVSDKERDPEDRLNRWDELELYRTKGGSYVCYRQHTTRYRGEDNRRSAYVCQTQEEAVNFFGFGSLAKWLYELADIPHVKRID